MFVHKGVEYDNELEITLYLRICERFIQGNQVRNSALDQCRGHCAPHITTYLNLADIWFPQKECSLQFQDPSQDELLPLLLRCSSGSCIDLRAQNGLRGVIRLAPPIAAVRSVVRRKRAMHVATKSQVFSFPLPQESPPMQSPLPQESPPMQTPLPQESRFTFSLSSLDPTL